MKNIAATLLCVLSFSSGVKAFNLTEPNVGWDKTDVSVCFADFSHYKNSYFSNDAPLSPSSLAPYTEEQKQVIKSIVTQEYTPEKTGIYFTGWNDCLNEPESDVYLFRMVNKDLPFHGLASMGQSGFITFVDSPLSKKQKTIYKKLNGKKKPFVALNTGSLGHKKLSLNNDLSVTALHEFGHLAGLHHEHADMESKNKKNPDLNCLRANFKPSQSVNDSTTKVSVYDKNSIMNYCYNYLVQMMGLNIQENVNTAGKSFDFMDPSVITTSSFRDKVYYEIRIGLSQGDLHALGCLYKYDARTKKAICREDFNPLENH